MWAFYGNCQPLKLSTGNISLIVYDAFKTCSAHGWLSCAIPQVGTGKEVGAGQSL